LGISGDITKLFRLLKLEIIIWSSPPTSLFPCKERELEGLGRELGMRAEKNTKLNPLGKDYAPG
jgi:hypothetical protein